MRFLGYSTDDAAVMPGEQRKVSLFWQATARPASDYTAFVQLLGKSARGPVSLWQAMPGAAYATSQWTLAHLCVHRQISARLPICLTASTP